MSSLADSLGAVDHFERAKDRADMRLDRLLGDIEFRSNVLVRFSLAQPRQNIDLSDGGHATLTLHGRADFVFLHNAAQANVTDLSAGLHLGIDSGNVVAAITSFGASRGAVLDLTGAGFTSIAQVLAGLHSDGQGGRCWRWVGRGRWTSSTWRRTACMRGISR